MNFVKTSICDPFTQHSGYQVPKGTPCTMLTTKEAERTDFQPCSWEGHTAAGWLSAGNSGAQKILDSFKNISSYHNLVKKDSDTAKHPGRHEIVIHRKEWHDLKCECIKSLLTNGPHFNHWPCGRPNERCGFRGNRVSNRRQGHSEVLNPIAQKQSCRAACLPGVWKTLVRSSAPKGEQQQSSPPTGSRVWSLEPSQLTLSEKLQNLWGVGLSWRKY